MTIERYDTMAEPDSAEWQALDEDERMSLTLDYHVRAGVVVPGLPMHATLHAAVENQLALGDAMPVQRKVRQLMAQGLNRHDTIHAVASVLIVHIKDMLDNLKPGRDPNQRYFSALGRLNTRKWLRSG